LSSCGCSVLTYTAYAVVFIMHYSVVVVSLTHCSISICAMSFSTMRLYHYIVPYVKHSFFYAVPAVGHLLVRYCHSKHCISCFYLCR